MMSAAILMAGMELASVRPTSADRDDTEGISFARSLGESVGDFTSLQEEKLANETAAQSTNAKGPALAKVPSGIVEAPVGAKDNAVVAQESAGHCLTVKSAVTDKTAQLPIVTSPGSQVEIAAKEVNTDALESPVREEAPVEQLSPVTPNARAVAVDAELSDQGSVMPISASSKEQPLMSDPGSVISGPTEIAGPQKEVVAAKPTVKRQDGEVAPKALKKSVDPTVKAIAVEPKVNITIPAEGATPAQVEVAVAGVALRNESGTTPKGFDGPVAVAKSSVEAASALVSGMARKELTHGVKADVADDQTTAPIASEVNATPKSDVGMEKIAVVAMVAGRDVDEERQNSPGSTAAPVHTMPAGDVLPSGIGFGLVASASTPTDSNVVKMPLGDAVVHSTGLASGAGDIQGTGAVAASMDGMPRMLAATPTSLEVGIQNGMHGWLKVRAEMTGGGVVNASVTTASPAAQEMLHRELPALTAYLQEEKVAVSAVVVHAAPASGGDTPGSAGMGNAGGQTSQRGNDGSGQRRNFTEPVSNDLKDAKAYRGLQGVDEDGVVPHAMYGSGGGWLSVRA